MHCPLLPPVSLASLYVKLTNMLGKTENPYSDNYFTVFLKLLLV